jgi:hypothetical protein
MEGIYYAIRRLPNLSLEQFQSRWLKTHGPLAGRHLRAVGAQRYVQVHTLDDPLNEVLRASRGCMEPFDGIAEIFGDREEMLKAMSTPEGLQAMGELQEDEKNFIDFSRSAMWIAKEHVIFER